MKKHLFGENNSLNEFQYLTELVIGFQPRHNLVKKKRSLLLDDSWSFIASSLNPILFAWELDLFSPYMSDSIRNQASINEMKWNKKKKTVFEDDFTRRTTIVAASVLSWRTHVKETPALFSISVEIDELPAEIDRLLSSYACVWRTFWITTLWT